LSLSKARGPFSIWDRHLGRILGPLYRRSAQCRRHGQAGRCGHGQTHRGLPKARREIGLAPGYSHGPDPGLLISLSVFTWKRREFLSKSVVWTAWRRLLAQT